MPTSRGRLRVSSSVKRFFQAKGLSVGGELLVARGAVGEVIKVIRDAPGGVAYHIHFESLLGRLLQIPEDALEPLLAEEHDDAIRLP